MKCPIGARSLNSSDVALLNFILPPSHVNLTLLQSALGFVAAATLSTRIAQQIPKWWSEGIYNTRPIDRVNAGIEKLNKKTRRKPEMYAFPTNLVLTFIQNIREDMEKLEQCTDDERDALTSKIAEQAHESFQILSGMGIPVVRTPEVVFIITRHRLRLP